MLNSDRIASAIKKGAFKAPFFIVRTAGLKSLPLFLLAVIQHSFVYGFRYFFADLGILKPFAVIGIA